MSARRAVVGGPCRRGGADERGFSLIELVVAVSVFAIMGGGLALTIGGGLNLARNNRNRSIAANLASQEMDDVRQASFTTLPLGLTEHTESVDGVPYTVRRETEWVDNSSTTGPCDSANSTPRVLRVSVSVLWSDMRGVPPAKSATVLSPPVGSYDPTNGHIAVKVRGGTADPLLGVPVHVSSASGYNANLTTTSDGCAFFAFVPPDTYTVSLGTIGYVDRQGSPSASQTTGVTSGATSSVAFDYDQAASFQLTMAAPDGGTMPPGVAVSVGNSGLLPTGAKSFAGTGTSRTVGNLYPYPDGYDLWAGDCADADPEGKSGSGVAFWDGATRDTTLGTEPGGTASGTVNLRTVNLTFVDLTTPTVAHSVVAVHDPDNGCPAGEQYTVATFTGSGVTDVALPNGTWTFQVPGASATGGTWFTVTVDPRITGPAAVNVSIG
jgi:prepilin-type N-terminal cleavage/methylation domain-containing protein